jgi:hypothetical protein
LAIASRPRSAECSGSTGSTFTSTRETKNEATEAIEATDCPKAKRRSSPFM